MTGADDMLSFWEYFSTCFVPFQRLELPLKALHKGTCETLQKAFLGDLHRGIIVINIPPRVGKTKINEAFVTWILAYFPDAQNIYTSYSNDLAKTSVKYIQEVIDSEWYRELFATRLGDIRQADEFTTAQGGRVVGDGVGGSLTGKGAGLKRRAGGVIIVDDPSKPSEALSRVESEKIRFWFENTLKSRRNSSQWTPIVVCMQRLDADDLSGYLLNEYPDNTFHIKFPAMVNDESTIPETVTTASLLETQRTNPFTFAAQYQQEPVVLGGNLIKTDDFRYYPAGSLTKFELKIITADTALKAKESADYSVLQCWGRKEKKAYLIDQIRGKWDTAQLIKNARGFYEKHHRAASPIAYMAVEEAAAGLQVIADLRKKGIPARGIVRHHDKVHRVNQILQYQVTGMVYLPQGVPWLPGFIAELAQFRKDGKSTKDDQVDPFADAVGLLLGKGTSILSVVGNDRRDRANTREEVFATMRK